MIYGFYFRFFNITKNKKLSIILSCMAHFLYMIKFRVQQLVCKPLIINISSEKALNTVEKVHPDPMIRPTYNMVEKDAMIDLSVIVPVYNYVHMIESNINSILNQKTKYNFELILVDDGSTDGARDILLKYNTRENVTAIFQENQGIAAARNTGISNAKGRYIMFVDCDDIIKPEIIENLMNKAYESDSDIVMCAHNLVKEKNGEIINIVPNIYPQKNLLGYKNDDEIMNYAGLPWAKVYKRCLFEKVRFIPGYWYEDTIVHCLLFTQCKKFSYIPYVGYDYKWYEGNFSHTQEKAKNPKSIDIYWLLLAIIDQYKKIGLPFDAKFYTVLLKHLSAFYYRAISQMDEKIQYAMFVLACDLLENYRPLGNYKLPYALRITEKAMMDRNIALWKLSIQYH